MRPVVLALVALGVLALPAAGAEPRETRISEGLLAHVSQGVQQRYLAEHPDATTGRLHAGLQALQDVSPQSHVGSGSLASFNRDDLGLPQNEESVGVCRSDTSKVLEGTNDYRGLVDPEENFTGWHFSTDGGQSLANEGLLPSIDGIPSGGDPVDVGASHCTFYAADLNYNPANPFLAANGIGVYKSDAATLASCNSGPTCWPTRRIVALSPNPAAGITPTPATPAFFFDKPWMDVGKSGNAEVVWVVYSNFKITGPGTDTLDYTVTLEAVRCTADLSSCTAPQVLSNGDQDIQFGDVTIGPDGRVYVTWAEIVGELPGQNGQPSQPQTFVVKSRVAEPGSTTFGPVHVVATIERPIPFGGVLQADDFRVASYPKNAVAQIGSGHNAKTRFFVTWDECGARPLDVICEEPVIKLTYSDDLGTTWSSPTVISRGGVNYFPTIATDPTNGHVVVAWYTNRFDAFDHRYDVELTSLPAVSGTAGGTSRLTDPSNEPDADPILGGFFIGDYLEVVAHGGTAWVGFNANYREVKLLDGLLSEGVPVNQQDNFLVRTSS